ncbi:hypothetical protein [Xiamenia xianingshaonis]|uniref:Uncharacterized protein n=1 Tax=Xiamenia xianingshaonis TaxID=2682776 RepID=A0A9E6SU19_9ACTN|nr:hypothetical protein [Xiamenia xianingshaonis]NGM17891.1 hypothetical protein [Eggerthellaceae bacterium zg-893]NHM14085.1 hypothetical protein [Xiamenia xianingshaonis]QTU83949.1 hypothetical protein J7S26_06160 [Xiamenia xianingshaonis]
MFYNYVEMEDGTQVAYSEMRKDRTVMVAVERPCDFGFDHAECCIPAYSWSAVAGFSDEEVARLDEFVRNNAPLIMRLAQEAVKAYA